MYIKCGKRSDLLKAKADYEARFNARLEQYNQESKNYHKAQDDWATNLEQLILDEFQEYVVKLPNLNVEVKPWGGFSADIEISFKYEPKYGEDYDNLSLRWDFKIELSESGEVVKHSDSWSGLQVVTIEQADDLLNSAMFLKAVTAYDWLPILIKARNEKPDYNTYFTVKDPHYDSEFKDPHYDKQIEEYDISQIVGKDFWIKVKSGHTYSWYKIVKATSNFYYVKEVEEYQLHAGAPSWLEQYIKSNSSGNRMSKDKINFVHPLEVITQEELLEMLE